MPNRVAQLCAEIEAAHPGATLAHRGEAGFSMRLPGGVEEHRYTTGPWHWMQPGDEDWREIDTDLEARPDATWKHGVRSAKFDTLLTDDGRRRFVPRRWIPTEYVEFGALEFQRPNTTWASVPTGIMSRVENRLVGSDLTDGRLEVGFHGRGSRTHLVLKRATMARPIRWAVSLVGVSWNNGVLVSASDAAEIGFIRPPTWQDSSGDGTIHEIPWTYSGGYITLTPDFTGAVYPITVDPDYSVAANADDGYAYADGSGFLATSENNLCGWFGNPINKDMCSWFRFQAIAASQGQNCTAATLTIVCSSTVSATNVYTNLFGIDEDDHAAPTDTTTWSADHSIHTSASVAWDITAGWSAGTPYTSPDFADILDEIFARANWQTGYDFGLHWDEDASASTAKRQFAALENTSYTEPVLSLTLAAAGTPQTLVGATTAAASLTAGMKLAKRLAGATTAAGAVAGGAKLSKKLGGAITAAATVAGGLTVTRQLAGAVTAAAATAGSAKVVKQLAGATTAAAAVAGSLKLAHYLDGAVAAAGQVGSTGKIGTELAGAIAAASTIQGDLKVAKRLAGAVTAAAAIQGALKLAHELDGATAAAAVTAGALTVTRQLIGAVSAASSLQGAIKTTHQLAGAVTAGASLTGGLKIAKPLAGASAPASATAADLLIDKQLAGAVTAASTVAGDLTVGAGGVAHELVGAVAAASTVAGTLAIAHSLAGAAAPAATVAGTVQAGKPLAGTVAAAAAILAGVPMTVVVAAGSDDGWASPPAGFDSTDLFIYLGDGVDGWLLFDLPLAKGSTVLDARLQLVSSGEAS